MQKIDDYNGRHRIAYRQDGTITSTLDATATVENYSTVKLLGGSKFEY